MRLTALKRKPAPAVDDIALCARSLGVSVGDRALLTQIDLTINPCELVAILGENGAGKSTLLKALAGETAASSGEVSLGDAPIAAWSALPLAQRRAVLSQDNTLNFAFSAMEVVLMGRSPWCRGYPSPQDHQIAAQLLHLLGADQLTAQAFTTLSGGERARIHLARVLAQIWQDDAAARYVLLDEPTAALDIAHQHGTLRILKRITRERRVGVVMVLHDLNLASQYADRVALLREGRMLALGNAAEVLTPSLILEAFGTPMLSLPHPSRATPVLVAA